MIGTSLSHFEITAELGAGGMGTVYRGKDTKLGREVAIKVLPELFTADAERLARFEREAKVLASLNHPSIAGIFEVGADGDVHYIVMELAEGEDLSERLAKGPMSFEDALAVARRIAEALEAAHRTGVVHRDLKPANVKLTPDGRVKVLDFGLAKALDRGMGGGPQGDLSHSPTLTAQMTSAGMILGTAAYMSPEQAKGEEVDKRSDIWSFGVVLWEMLAGQKTFAENTVSETLAAVLKSDPDHSALPANIPVSVRRLIERCLQKDPEQRLHDIADARLEIEAVLRGDATAAMVVEPTAPTGSGRWKTIAAVASLVAVAAVGSRFLPTRQPTAPPPSPIRFAIDRPPLYLDGRATALAVSPDGSKVAYWAKNEEGSDQIFLRSLDAVEATPIQGTEGGFAPFFSPDGSRIGFADFFGIRSVALIGGASRRLLTTQDFRGAVWADDDSIWFGPETETGLWRMDSDGSNARQMTTPDAERGERSHRWPAVLPGSDVVLFTVANAEISVFDQASIDVLRVSTGERKTLIDGGMFPLFVEPDILLYSASGNLFAARFDTGTLTLKTQPTLAVEHVKSDPLSGIVAAAVAADGSLAVGKGTPFASKRQLVIYDRDGTSEPLTGELKPYQGVAVSPDGSTLALDVDGANSSIWLLDLERDIQTRLTTRWNHQTPVWSPDGSALVTSTSSGGIKQIALHRLNEGTSQIIHDVGDSRLLLSSWSKDNRLALMLTPQDASMDIWTLPMDDPSQGKPLLDSQFSEWNPRFSPDGRWVAFSSDESGQEEIYVVPSTGATVKTRVSSGGGSFAAWNPDGSELLFYDRQRNSILTVPVQTGDRIRVGRPTTLFRTTSVFLEGLTILGVTPDGRIIMIKTVDDPEEDAIDLIFTRHWVAALEERLSAP